MTVKYPTPDTPANGVSFSRWHLRVPNIDIIQRVVMGALAEIGFTDRWIEDGTMSLYETVQLVKSVKGSVVMSSYPVGSIVPFYLDTLPDGCLLADGSTYLKSDYPELWDVSPVSMRTLTDFTLPDLTDRFLIATGNNPVRSVGGEDAVTLDVTQMPSHTHTFTSPTFGIDVESVGVPDPTGVGNPPAVLTTSSTGGNQPHNNMPPYYAVKYAIFAGF